MALTKNDLSAIRNIVRGEIGPADKKIDKIDKKFEKLFNFLDKNYLQTKNEIRGLQRYLHLPISDY